MTNRQVVSLFLGAGLLASLNSFFNLSSADDVARLYEVNEGETLAEFQSHRFPYLDRREIRISKGDGELDLTLLDRLTHQDRLALHLVNDTGNNVNVVFPDFKTNFVVPAGTDRIYEFETSATGFHRYVSYDVQVLESLQQGGIAQSTELTRIIQERVATPVFVDDEPAYRIPSSPAGIPVRGYW